MRFSQCTETCTTDCGHCKGRPVEALRADNERLSRRLAGRFEETEKLRNEARGLRQELDEARAERNAAIAKVDRWRAELVAKSNDLLNVRGILSPNGGERVPPPEIPMDEEVAPAIEWLVAELDRMRSVVETAEALVDDWKADRATHGHILIVAVDAYRASTPDAEPAPTAFEWNARHPVGTQVRAYPGTREGRFVDGPTRSLAWTLGSGHAVVAVEGLAGGIALTHVDVLPAEPAPGMPVDTEEEDSRG